MENVIWIMGIGGVLMILFKIFVRVDIIHPDEESNDQRAHDVTQEILKDKVLIKTLEDLLDSNKEMNKRIDIIMKQLSVQGTINTSSTKLFTTLVLEQKKQDDAILELHKIIKE